jgi:serine-type D-Ala-D-Ala carboxypeptidase/endopeptidase (penicillin-binding protein 4)
MLKISFVFTFLLVTCIIHSQEKAVQLLLSDSCMIHASASISIRDAASGESIISYNSGKSLIPASVLKLITSGVALEMLGPQHKFRTIIGFTGSVNKRTGRLSGNILIKGGGDPALGSKYFRDHYRDFISNWVSEIKMEGIKKIDGGVITDDSYYDFLPVPSGWQWEDIGNYYGAGVYGLSAFDNSFEIHLRTSSDNSPVIISAINPMEYRHEFENRLVASDTIDEGNIFSAPYSDYGWLAGTIPINQEDYILEGSVSDPPMLIAGLLNTELEESGIRIKNNPTTVRMTGTNNTDKFTVLSEISSPPLSGIIEVLNHESMNLYAETLLKELGKRFRNNGSTESGVDVIKEFLFNAGIPADGMFIEDGSGLSPKDVINAEELTNFLIYMKNRGKYFTEYYKSLPEAGKEGTLKLCFRDPVFDGRMNAKSGSMRRVRCYAGYFTTNSNRNMVFSILVNNFTGPSSKVISGIEEIIKEIILSD